MILVIDNYDSFTYNLVQYIGQCGAEEQVWRNDKITLEEVRALKPDGILLSPGPCTPSESGICLDISRAALAGEMPPLFGVCLGHQAIGYVSGATVRQAKTIMHGKMSLVKHRGQGVLHGLPSPLEAIRYHSLVVDGLSDDFAITARSDDDDEIMALKHKTLPIEGVQFHPESVLTKNGIEIVRNFVAETSRVPV